MDRLQMENPHEVEQNVLLERIIKNADKCNEAVIELNHCFKEFTQANRSIKVASQLFDNYANVTANYMKNTKMMPDPK